MPAVKKITKKQATEPTVKRGRGRPKGSKNTPKAQTATIKNSSGYELPDVNVWQGYMVSAWVNGGRTELTFVKARDDNDKLYWRQITPDKK